MNDDTWKQHAKDLLQHCQLTDECWDELLEVLLSSQYVENAIPLFNEQVEKQESVLDDCEHGIPAGELCDECRQEYHIAANDPDNGNG